MHRITVRIVCALFSLVFATGLFAFGNSGHQIVCHIALLELDAADRAEVVRLATAYERPDGRHEHSFEDACLFADEARRRADNGQAGWEDFADYENWHFFNLPRTSRVADPTHCQHDCVLEGIDQDSTLLRDGADDQERSEGLIFLAHWIGDIHQPLHISFADDRGGNRIKLSAQSKYSSDLHAVWDTGIISAAMRSAGLTDPFDYAVNLRNSINSAQRTTWLSSSKEQWAQESYDITLGPDVQYCRIKLTPFGQRCRPIGGQRTLTSAYQLRFEHDIELRLKQAGVRLANEIRKALHP
ncbi:MAG TPA: S1/P1 nuclease [Thermoanaerobaculia bacterium]